MPGQWLLISNTSLDVWDASIARSLRNCPVPAWRSRSCSRLGSRVLLPIMVLPRKCGSCPSTCSWAALQVLPLVNAHATAAQGLECMRAGILMQVKKGLGSSACAAGPRGRCGLWDIHSVEGDYDGEIELLSRESCEIGAGRLE